MRGISATAAVEGHSAAGVTSVTIAVASVESVLPANVVGATTTATQLYLLALVLLLTTLATSCLTSLVGCCEYCSMHAGGCMPSALQSILICPCMALMVALLFHRLSCVAGYATQKLETALVS